MATPMTELPDGRLVCTEHQLTICGYCCVDYSFMDEILNGSEEDPDELKEESTSPNGNNSPPKKTQKPKKQSKNMKNAFSRNKMVKEHWGNRPNFQASYGLTMSPDDIAEGNEILKAMERADKQNRSKERE